VPCSRLAITGTWLVSVMKIEWLALFERPWFDRCDLGQRRTFSSRCRATSARGTTKGGKENAKQVIGICTAAAGQTGQGVLPRISFIRLAQLFLLALWIAGVARLDVGLPLSA